MDDKHRIIIALQDSSKSALAISEELGINYGTVLKTKRKYEEALINGTVEQLINTDKILLNEVGKELSLVTETENLVKGLEGLERLQDDLQRTAININNKVNSLMLSVSDLSELEIAVDIIRKLNDSFFNKNFTQINVQNNMAETPKYTQFLGDAPGA